MRSEFLLLPAMKPPSFLGQEVRGEPAERDVTTDLLEDSMCWGLVISGADLECGMAGLGIDVALSVQVLYKDHVVVRREIRMLVLSGIKPLRAIYLRIWFDKSYAHFDSHQLCMCLQFLAVAYLHAYSSSLEFSKI